MSALFLFPECWGHRGASATFPENTLASFRRACEDGVTGIESDVHVSNDDVVIMFHDPSLDRTIENGKGFIRDQPWNGPDGMEHLRTVKRGLDGQTHSIPTFQETINLLMQPENRNVHFNVDVKVQNDPDRLFALMHKIISAQPDWETTIAPRILLGLWHPKFLAPAKKHLPMIKLAHIGMSPYVAKEFFWESCGTFSMNFSSLLTPQGERFRKECKAEGKKLMVWTVNRREEMIEAVRWGVHAILTDVTAEFLALKHELEANSALLSSTLTSRLFLWTRLDYYTLFQFVQWSSEQSYLEKYGGRFIKDVTTTTTIEATPVAVV